MEDIKSLSQIKRIAEQNPKALLERITKLEKALDVIAQGSQLCLDRPLYRLPENICDEIRKLRDGNVPPT